MKQFLIANWDVLSGLIILLLPVAEVVVRLTPTKKDDTFIDLLKKLFNKIPNKRKGGGVHRKKIKPPVY